jgi:molybdopterin-guanine dinucleotide biosynthesis protein A
MKLRSDVVGAILAGGKSSRMGTEKALLPVQGRPMVQVAVETLAAVFSDVILVGGSKDNFGFLEREIIQDVFEGCGPLAGIHSALNSSQGRPVFVLSCDTPFVPPRLVEFVMEYKSPAPTKVASFESVLQPLCALYDVTSLQAIEEDLRQGKYSIIKTLKNINYAEISITPDLPFFTPSIFRNVNQPEDYRTLINPLTGRNHG